MRPLERLAGGLAQSQRDVLERCSLKFHGSPRPAIEHEIECLIEAVPFRRWVKSESGEERRAEASAESEQNSTLREVIERGHIMRNAQRVMDGEQERSGSEPDARSPAGDGGQEGQRRGVHPGREVHLGKPDRVQVDLFGEFNPLHHACEAFRMGSASE